MPCSTASTLVNNFKRGFSCPPQQEEQPVLSQSEPQTDAPDTNHPEWSHGSVTPQRWATAMTERVYVPGCACAFCAMCSETDDVVGPMCRPHSRGHTRRSLPSFRSVMEVLYPPSDLSAPSPFPDPPSYSRGDSSVCPPRGGDTEISLLTSSTTPNIEEMPLSRSLYDPLAHDPSLTGVPSQGVPFSRVPPVEPNPPIIDSDDNVPGEQLPTYSRYDQRRPRFPTASDILGPYPPLSVLRPSAP